MKEQRTKAVGTFALIIALPLLMAVPQVAQYPMTAISGVLAMLLFLNFERFEGYLPTGEPDKDRARPVSVPGV